MSDVCSEWQELIRICQEVIKWGKVTITLRDGKPVYIQNTASLSPFDGEAEIITKVEPNRTI